MPGKYTFTTVILTLSLVLLLLSAAAAGEEDILILERGKALYGKILEETEEHVKIKCKYGEQIISKESIKEICRAAEFYEAFKKKRDKVEKKKDAGEYYKLGLWCRERRRETEANQCFNRAMFINPQHKEARGELGYKHYKGKWYSKAKYNEQVRGLVLYEGEWITEADKEKYDQGLIKHKGRWVTPEVLAKEEKEKAERLARARQKRSGKGHKKSRKIPLPQPMPNEDQWMADQKGRYGWTTAIKTKRYYIFSTAAQENTEYFGECMDALFEAYVRKFEFTGKQARRFTICIFNTYQEFVQRCRVPMGVGGFYHPDGHALYVPNGLPPGTNMSTLNILAHEGHHQFQHFAIGDVMKPMTFNAIWVIEGGATYCEVAQFADGKATIGLVNPERLRRLKGHMQRNRHVKLSRLTRMGQRGFTMHHYDHAWGFIYYLMTKYHDKYVKFFHSLKAGETKDNVPGTPAVPPGMRGAGGMPGGLGKPPNTMGKFEEILGSSVAPMEEPWKEFILGLE